MSTATETTTTSEERGRPLPITGTAARIEAREILRMFNRRKWHLVGVTALVCVLTMLFLLQLVPEYRASALVMLDTRKAKVTNTTDVLSTGLLDIPAVQTEIEVIRSASLLGRVVEKLHLDVDPEFGAVSPTVVGTVLQQGKNFIAKYIPFRKGPGEPGDVDGPKTRAVVALTRNLVTAVRGRSYVISVSVDSSDPRKAKRIVDTITDFYIVDQLQAKLDANKHATDFFNDRLDELKRNVEANERAVAAFREKSGLTVAKDSTIASQSLAELNSQLVQARAQRADRESRLIALQQAARNPATLGGVSEVLANGLISSLRSQEAEVARRVGDLSQRYGDSHPRILQARAEQSQIQARIAQEVAKIISSVQGDAEAARGKEAELQAQVDLLERKAGGLGQNEVELRQLEREAQSSRAVYEDFLKRFKELREQQDIQQPDARILAPASVPTTPAFPRYGLTMSGALLVGLVLGAVVILLLERLDGGFRTGEQIERMTGRPLVGMIPALNRSILGKLTPARFAIEKMTSAYAEALRSAYTAVTLGTLDRPPRVVMVTSSLPAEGKSTFACSLAGLVARASADKKILVMDCDLRRSSVGSTLNVQRPEGTIDEYLAGTKTLEEVVGRDEQSGVYYVLARSNTPNSAEILDSNAMRSCIAALSSQFDLIFLDTPPLMAVADALVTARLSDYILFLVRWERTPREIAINALRLLRDLPKSIGVVLVQVDIRRHSKYGYGDYGYYYSKYRDYYSG
ncbi:MAG TPA: polysaccharide biosynthesis tyrosine autokinase [Reyranella sp.]